MLLGRMLNELSPLLRLRDLIDIPPVAPRGYAAAFPALNAWETQDGTALVVEAELPGLSIEQIDVTVLGNELSISGERRLAQEAENKGENGVTWLRRERAQGKFTRTITLPWDVDADRVEAKLINGVLTVTLPKVQSAQPKKVKLQSA
jgi:HSP20 family protein